MAHKSRSKTRPLKSRDFYISSRSPLSSKSTEVASLYSSETDYEETLSNYREILANHQDQLFADGRRGLVLIFQGMDGSGKDSTIKHVFSGLNPQGVVVSTFATPSKEELAHDFIWRVHARLGPRGKISILNRSYYEEVVTVRVHKEFLRVENLPIEMKNKEFFSARLKSIVDFENHLSREGYQVIKFFLHLSKKGQARKLLSRLEDPTKNWKFDPSDLADRDLWEEFQSAYGKALEATSTDSSPWYAIPADDKKNARLIVAKILAEKMDELHLKFPTKKITDADMTKARQVLGAFLEIGSKKKSGKSATRKNSTTKSL